MSCARCERRKLPTMMRISETVHEVVTPDGPVGYPTLTEARDNANGMLVQTRTVEIDVPAAYDVRVDGESIATYDTVREAADHINASRAEGIMAYVHPVPALPVVADAV